jgi:uncharacterized protein with NRDE domain
MCLALLALDAHPFYSVVIVANRDEYHARPTAPAAWWEEGWLAGRDLRGGGTWLGIMRSGRFALLTNFRDPASNDSSAPSRGSLVPAVLADPAGVVPVLERVRAVSATYNGFNLLAGTPAGAAWVSNRSPEVKSLGPGTYGLSNALLDSPWPKLLRTKTALAQWIAAGDRDTERLFTALAQRELAADTDLPSTGVTLEWERRLSAPFIVSDAYGTRSSTVITIDRDGDACFIERSFDPGGLRTGQVEHCFRIT